MPMTRWEYRVCPMRELGIMVEVEAGGPAHAPELLNEMGAEGWEFHCPLWNTSCILRRLVTAGGEGP
jgi:hypothetical protein